MAKRRNFCIGHNFHSYSRGVNKDLIFKDKSDYLKFQNLIERFNIQEKQRRPKRVKSTKKLVDIYCYILMPNHFHFLFKEISDNGISKFIQKVLSQYTLYFNKKYKRTGTLFESRFKDKLVDTDQYFEYLVGYMWNNPIKLINPKYKSIDLFYGKINLTEKEKEFTRNYPYKKFPKNYFGLKYKTIGKKGLKPFDF